MELISTAIVATGDSVTVHNSKTRDFIAVQATAAVTSTVLIQGSMGKIDGGGDHAWITLTTLTDSAADTVAWFPFMRADVTAAGGQVDVALAGS